MNEEEFYGAISRLKRKQTQEARSVKINLKVHSTELQSDDYGDHITVKAVGEIDHARDHPLQFRTFGVSLYLTGRDLDFFKTHIGGAIPVVGDTIVVDIGAAAEGL